MENKRHGILYCLITSIFIVCPFVISFTANDAGTYIPIIAPSPQHLEMEKGLILFLGILFLMISLSKFVVLDTKNKRLAKCLGIFFSCCVVMGKSYEAINSWDYIFSSFSTFIASCCIIAGYAIIFYYLIGTLFVLMQKNDDIVLQNPALKKFSSSINKFLSKKSLLKFWSGLMILWLPYLIINYPAVIHADSGVMLGQYMYGTLHNHHPVVQTIIWGGFVDLFYKLSGSYNLGVFLFAAIQYIYGSLIFALLFDYVYKKGYPVLIILFAFLTVGLMPAFPRNVTAVCKDSNYTLYVLFMVWLTIKTTDYKEEIAKSKYYLLPVWIITVLFVAFSRKNGIHLIILSVIPLIIYLRKCKRTAFLISAAVLIGIGGYLGGEFVISDVYNIENDDTQETYSIPFQQTARYVREHGSEVTAQERDTIATVLDYDNLSELYNPQISDPVKSTFKADSTKEDFNRYLYVWFNQLCKHPATYIQATLNGIYGYFYPENIGYYSDLFYMTMCVDDTKIFAPEALKNAADKLCDINMKSRQLPIIGLFSSLGFYVWIDIIALMYFIVNKKDKKYIVYNMPALITLLICIASPVNNVMRYGLPIIFIAPFMLCMCFSKKK